jgi:recombinational DNA repair protein RecR
MAKRKTTPKAEQPIVEAQVVVKTHKCRECGNVSESKQCKRCGSHLTVEQ